jgi:hypothetical protein
MKTNNLKHFIAALMMSALVGNKDMASANAPMFRGHAIGGYNPIYIPRHGKFKGWMRERRRSTFNKNK